MSTKYDLRQLEQQQKDEEDFDHELNLILKTDVSTASEEVGKDEASGAQQEERTGQQGDEEKEKREEEEEDDGSKTAEQASKKKVRVQVRTKKVAGLAKNTEPQANRFEKKCSCIACHPVRMAEVRERKSLTIYLKINRKAISLASLFALSRVTGRFL